MGVWEGKVLWSQLSVGKEGDIAPSHPILPHLPPHCAELNNDLYANVRLKPHPAPMSSCIQQFGRRLVRLARRLP